MGAVDKEKGRSPNSAEIHHRRVAEMLHDSDFTRLSLELSSHIASSYQMKIILRENLADSLFARKICWQVNGMNRRSLQILRHRASGVPHVSSNFKHFAGIFRHQNGKQCEGIMVWRHSILVFHHAKFDFAFSVTKQIIQRHDGNLTCLFTHMRLLAIGHRQCGHACRSTGTTYSARAFLKTTPQGGEVESLQGLQIPIHLSFTYAFT